MDVIVEESRITSKGQMTLPKAVRQALGVDAGDVVTFRIGPDGVRVERGGEPAGDDPALESFLELLANHIAKRPDALAALTPAFRRRIAGLTDGVLVDLDETIEGEVPL